MGHFVILLRLTSQGITHIKDSPTRVEAAKKQFEKFGVKVKEFYLLMGEYDTILIVEANDQQDVAKACLALGSLGNVRTETLCAFTEKQFKEMVNHLS